MHNSINQLYLQGAYEIIGSVNTDFTANCNEWVIPLDLMIFITILTSTLIKSAEVRMPDRGNLSR